MYDYGMVKSIHDQRMRQFMIEAERAHLVRMLRKDRSSQGRLLGRMALRLRYAFLEAPASHGTQPRFT